jgi:hypothetical protein
VRSPTSFIDGRHNSKDADGAEGFFLDVKTRPALGRVRILAHPLDDRLSYGRIDRVIVSFARTWLTLPASSDVEASATFSTCDTPRVA